MTTSLPGLNQRAVSEWMTTNLQAWMPLTFDLIAGGRSNLTFRVTDAKGQEFVLRRPPTNHVLDTAHDMAREYTIISALHPHGIPLPRPLGLCTDETVNDAPFYVMAFVDGIIPRDRAEAEAALSLDARRTASESVATTLAALHDIDVDAVGLGTLARHDGYIERQLRRWARQYEQMGNPDDSTGRLVREVGQRLSAKIPVQQRTSVVHGDYRLDNTVLDEAGRVRAILDWEICTLGDPLADLGVLLMYWTERGDPVAALSDTAPTTADGFLGRDQVIDVYAGHSSLDLSDIHYYRAFGFWKLVCMLQGVYARYQGGAVAGDPRSVGDFPERMALVIELAKSILDKR